MCGDNSTNVIDGSGYVSSPFHSGNALGATDGIITPATASSCLHISKELTFNEIFWTVDVGVFSRQIETVKIWGVFGSMQRLNNLDIQYTHTNHAPIFDTLVGSHSDLVFPDVVTYGCIY